MSVALQIIDIVKDSMQIDYSIDIDTALLGAVPEFDSMAVVTVLTSLEESFGIMINDDEVDASIFETVGALVSFVEGKV